MGSKLLQDSQWLKLGHRIATLFKDCKVSSAPCATDTCAACVRAIERLHCKGHYFEYMCTSCQTLVRKLHCAQLQLDEQGEFISLVSSCDLCVEKMRGIKKDIYRLAVTIDSVDKGLHYNRAAVLHQDALVLAVEHAKQFARGGTSLLYRSQIFQSLTELHARISSVQPVEQLPRTHRWDGGNDHDGFMSVCKIAGTATIDVLALFMDYFISSICYSMFTKEDPLRRMIMRPVLPLVRLPALNPSRGPTHHLSMIMPRMHGSLGQLFKHSKLSTCMLMYTVTAIAALLGHLQRTCRFQHRDLKLENIFFCWLPEPKDMCVPVGTPGSRSSVKEILFRNVPFEIVLSDFGFSALYTGGDIVGLDALRSNAPLAARRTFNVAADMDRFVMDILARDDGAISPLACEMLWNFCGTNLYTTLSVYAVRRYYCECEFLLEREAKGAKDDYADIYAMKSTSVKHALKVTFDEIRKNMPCPSVYKRALRVGHLLTRLDHASAKRILEKELVQPPIVSLNRDGADLLFYVPEYNDQECASSALAPKNILDTMYDYYQDYKRYKGDSTYALAFCSSNLMSRDPHDYTTSLDDMETPYTDETLATCDDFDTDSI